MRLLLAALPVLATVSAAQAQGGQWQAQSSNLPSTPSGIRDMSVVSPTASWGISYSGATPAVVEQRFTRTADGVTWTAGLTPAPTTSTEPVGISAVDASTAWIVMGDNVSNGGYLYRTQNGGTSWTRQATGAFVASQGGYSNAVHMYSATNGTCMGDPSGGYFEVLRTTDGSAWTRVPSGSLPTPVTGEVGLVGAFAFSGNKLWFGTNQGRVIYSADQGNTWAAATLSSGLQLNRLAFCSDLVGIAATTNPANSATQLWRTSNGGASWSTVSPTGSYLGGYLAAVPGTTSTFINTSSAGSSYSTDGGLSWTAIDGLQHTAAGFLDSQTGYSGGFTGQTSPSMYRWLPNSPAGTYCTPVQPACGVASGPTITNVSLPNTSLSVNSGCANTSGAAYTQYAATPASNTATLAAGGFYSVSVTVSSAASVAVWVDYNRNNVFETTEYTQLGSTTGAGQASGTIRMPTPVTAGLSTMRVRARAAGTVIGSNEACSAFSNGEAEDFVVTLTNTLCTPPTANAGTSATVCGGSTFQLGGSTAQSGVSYSWSVTPAIAGFSLSAAQGTVVLPAPTTPTAYTFTLTATNSSGCSASSQVVATVNPIPGAPTTTGAARCGAGSLTLSASGAPSGGTYRWYSQATGGTALLISSANTASTGTISATTTYYVSVADGSSAVCESPRTAVTATVSAPPTAGLVANGPTSYCLGGSVSLTATGGTTGSQYQFYNGGQLISTQTSPTVSVSAPGTYTVTITNPNPGCSATSGGVVVSIYAAAVANAGPNVAFCSGGSAQLGTPAVSNTTYQWSPSTGLNNATTAQPTVSLTNASSGTITTTYTVVATTGNGCSASSTVQITVNPLPAPVIAAGGPTTFCQGGSVVLTASGGTAYQWSTGATTASITVAASGSYTVTATSAAGCTATSAATAVIINPLPTPGITAGGATTFCQGGSVVLNATGGASYLWSNGATTASITATTSGSYTVTATSAAGCSATSAATVVTVNPTPATPTVTANGTTLSSSSATGNQWYLNGVLIVGATGQTYTTTGPGTYTVVVSGAGNCPSSPSTPRVITAARGELATASFSLYPNPTRDGQLVLSLTGYSGRAELSVLNAVGQVVQRQSLVVSGRPQPLQLAGLAAGVYVVMVQTANGLLTHRLVQE